MMTPLVSHFYKPAAYKVLISNLDKGRASGRCISSSRMVGMAQENPLVSVQKNAADLFSSSEKYKDSLRFLGNKVQCIREPIGL